MPNHLADALSPYLQQHADNPVNRARAGGVQVELPPMIRWNREAHNWSDHLATPRAPEVEQLIDVLASASREWVRSSG